MVVSGRGVPLAARAQAGPPSPSSAGAGAALPHPHDIRRENGACVRERWATAESQKMWALWGKGLWGQPALGSMWGSGSQGGPERR